MFESNNIQAIFLDRDGTINIDHGYIYRIEDFKFVPGALEALKILAARQIPLYIVTNQAGIARGLYTESDVLTLHRWMLDVLQAEGVTIREVLYCPHHAQGIVPAFTQLCDCRKPAPGMIERVLRREGYDPARTFMIGDKPSDVGAGRAAGTRTVLLSSGDGMLMETPDAADFTAPDLRAAVRLVFGE